jgi:hypothetical protein
MNTETSLRLIVTVVENEDKGKKCFVCWCHRR